jgi:hypothetical protein
MLAHAEALEADIDVPSERTAELIEPWTASLVPGGPVIRASASPPPFARGHEPAPRTSRRPPARASRVAAGIWTISDGHSVMAAASV